MMLERKLLAHGRGLQSGCEPHALDTRLKLRHPAAYRIAYTRRTRLRHKSTATLRALWQDDFPRLIEDIPRRLPRPDLPSVVESFGGVLRELFVPSNVSGQVSCFGKSYIALRKHMCY